jgi:hypothetical protein
MLDVNRDNIYNIILSIFLGVFIILFINYFYEFPRIIIIETKTDKMELDNKNEKQLEVETKCF